MTTQAHVELTKTIAEAASIPQAEAALVASFLIDEEGWRPPLPDSETELSAHLPADWREQLHKVEHGAMDARSTAKTVRLIESWIEVTS